MDLVETLRHQAGCLDSDLHAGDIDMLDAAADEIGRLREERRELQGRIAMAIDAKDCCVGCMVQWLTGELDEEQKVRVMEGDG